MSTSLLIILILIHIINFWMLVILFNRPQATVIVKRVEAIDEIDHIRKLM